MASSSVSQESLEIDDHESVFMKNRTKINRIRGLAYCSGDCGDGQPDSLRFTKMESVVESDSFGSSADIDSSSRTSTASVKDKQRNRPSYIYMGILPKDKRKLREKRRSTGVINISAESTGDSLDDDDDGGGGEGSVHANKEVEKNTALNAGAPVVSTCGSLQPTHHRCNVPEANVGRCLSAKSLQGSKSPSIFEGDLEDSRHYQSRASCSGTDSTLVRQSSLLHETRAASKPSFRPSSHFSSIVSNKRFDGGHNQALDSKVDTLYHQPRSSSFKSNMSELASHYLAPQDRRHGDANLGMQNISNANRFANCSLQKNFIHGKQDNSVNSSSSSHIGFSGGKGHLGNKCNGMVTGSDESVLPSSLVVSPQYHASKYNVSRSLALSTEQLLELERGENKRLLQQLAEKDCRIVELEKEVADLNKECEELDGDNIKLLEENKVMISAMQRLNFRS